MDVNPFLKRLEALCIGPNMTDKGLYAIVQACLDAQAYIAGLAPNLHQVSNAVKHLDGSDIEVIGLIAYPLGNLPIEVKRVQIEAALESGARQIAITMRHESLNAGDYVAAREEAETLCKIAAAGGAEGTLIANLDLLNQAAKVTAAEIAQSCAGTIVTASGMGVETSIEDVAQLHKDFGPDLEITACGTITLAEQVVDLLDAGAHRICTPSPFTIIAGLETLTKHGYLEA